MRKLQQFLYVQLDPLVWKGDGLSPLNRIIFAVIIGSIIATVVESEPLVLATFPAFFAALNPTIAVAFLVEYMVRIWAQGAHPDYNKPGGRLRYMATPGSLIDLIALLTLWIDILFVLSPALGVMLRLVRVLRVITLTRNSRWSQGMRLLGRAISIRRFELALSFGFTGVVLLFSATILYAAEGTNQPEAFGSIPRAMWWAVATLTTVGYGDVYPVTALGKFCAGIVALTSIAIVAMPTGIMAAAFSDAFQEIRDRHKKP